MRPTGFARQCARKISGALASTPIALTSGRLASAPPIALYSRAKMAGGEAIWQLYRLRQVLIADLDFDSIARTHGRAVLRECCGRDVTDATVDMLVDSVLEILRRVVRDQLN